MTWCRARPRYDDVVALILILGLSSSASVSRAEKPLAGPELGADQALFRARCRTAPGLGVLVSPERPVVGRTLRFLVVAERAHPDARVHLQGPAGSIDVTPLARGGPPWWWYVELATAAKGRYRLVLSDGKGKVLACRRVTAQPRRARFFSSGTQDHWPIRQSWQRLYENIYAAWTELLFDVPAGTRVSWTPLHQVIRDPKRNVLYNFLGAEEDGPDSKTAVVLKPDCADLPYFLRAYFAWKLRLPFGYRQCDRGNSKRPARCGELKANEGKLAGDEWRKLRPAEAFSKYLRHHVSYVHSASGRTAPDDDESDLYPVKISRWSIRPGTVYVDPYGHLLIVARWHEQTATQSGLLYAVDGHPDLSVGRKRFWRGAFMFNADTQGGAGGFKAFRPLVRREGKVVALANDEIKRHAGYANYSAEQYKRGTQGFYDRMERVINPRPLSPTHAYGERLKALHELMQERVDSVKAGEDYLKKTAYKSIPMPVGPRIFETRGPWEDFSTPARDMRLLIAIHDVMQYPQRVIAFPKWFALRPGESAARAKVAMDALFASYTRSQGIVYTRSDGTSQTLTLAQIIERRRGLEVAYNPNDCIELRWGGDAAEMKSCRRRAPKEQRERMQRYRSWFTARNRPPIR
jgi:hypothetical protein